MPQRAQKRMLFFKRCRRISLISSATSSRGHRGRPHPPGSQRLWQRRSTGLTSGNRAPGPAGSGGPPGEARAEEGPLPADGGGGSGRRAPAAVPQSRQRGCWAARSSCSLVSWKPCSRSLEMMVRYRVISSLT